MSTTISGTNGVTFPDSTSMQTGQQACKAWVNFNGTGTVAIRESYNVSSITDNGTGSYTVNYTTPMADATYAYTANHTGYAGNIGWTFPYTSSASSLNVLTFGDVGSYNVDPTAVTVTVFSN